MTKVITEAWNDTKSALLEGLEGQKKTNYGCCIRKYTIIFG
jgi:hypothetical protein